MRVSHLGRHVKPVTINSKYPLSVYGSVPGQTLMGTTHSCIIGAYLASSTGNSHVENERAWYMYLKTL